MKGFVRCGLVSLAVVASGVAACGEGDPSQLSINEQIELKQDLCGSRVTIPEGTCQRKCWLAAPCADFSEGPSDDTGRCLGDCQTEFSCDGTKRIPASWVCDGTDDCDDGSDETDCESAGPARDAGSDADGST
jgi:hypothetical protein